MNKVSVIIPNYNHAAFLSQRIDSILSQTYQNFEIIILDDCSKDNSKQIIEFYSGQEKIKQIVYNLENSGSTFAQWEKGIALAKGDLIWIAESDDFAESSFLETIIKIFTLKPHIDFIFTRSYDIDEKGTRLGLSYANLKWNNEDIEIEGKEFVKKYLLYNCTIPNVSAVVFKKNKFRDSFLNTDFKLCGDWFFYTNILKNCNLYYLSQPLNNHRFHTTTVRSKLSNSIRALEERLLLVDMLVVQYNLPTINDLKKNQIHYFVSTTKFKNFFSVYVMKKLFLLFKQDLSSYFLLFKFLILRIVFNLFNKGTSMNRFFS